MGHRFVQKNSGNNQYQFVVPMTGCGTQPITDGNRIGFEIVVIVQNEEIIQEIWDTARRLQCLWQNRFAKLITFNPFTVETLEASVIKLNANDVKCWMDVLMGKGLFGKRVQGMVRVGDEMTLAIYVEDGGAGFDIHVSNCYAYDNSDVESQQTSKIQLSDANGCSLKPKLFGHFQLTRQTADTEADVIAYTRLSAFKFPGNVDIYLTCEVELCQGSCEAYCDKLDPLTNVDDTVISLRTTSTTPSTTTAKFVCTPLSSDARCPPSCFPGNRDPRCPESTTTSASATPTNSEALPAAKEIVCEEGASDPRCPVLCIPGSLDPRCTTPQSPTTTTEATMVFVCTPGSLDPKCGPTSTEKPLTTIRPSGDECQGDNDPRCSPNHAFHAWQFARVNSNRRQQFTWNRMIPRNAAVRRKRDSTGKLNYNINLDLLHRMSVISADDLELSLSSDHVQTKSFTKLSSTDVQSQVVLTSGDILCFPTIAFGAGLIVLVSILIVVTAMAFYFALKVRYLKKSSFVS